MTEYIDKEAAINTILHLIPKIDDDGYCWVIRGDAAMAIDSMPAADVQPVVVCADCEHNNHCLTQEFVEDCGKIPLDRNTFFCADGKRRSNV